MSPNWSKNLWRLNCAHSIGINTISITTKTFQKIHRIIPFWSISWWIKTYWKTSVKEHNLVLDGENEHFGVSLRIFCETATHFHLVTVSICPIKRPPPTTQIRTATETRLFRDVSSLLSFFCSGALQPSYICKNQCLHYMFQRAFIPNQLFIELHLHCLILFAWVVLIKS